MIRILLIEALLFAFIRRMAVVQAISMLLIMVITIFIGARVDPQLLHEWGGSVRDDLPAIVLRAVRTAA